MSVMISFSSWNGTKMHANKHMITDVLKGELGFKGFVVSDWGGIDQISDDYEAAVISAINAGVDMNMVPYDYMRFMDVMKQAVTRGAISQERLMMPCVVFCAPSWSWVSSSTRMATRRWSKRSAHRRTERWRARRYAKSLVLLKNDNDALPITKDTATIFVAGSSADSVDIQCGGWSLTWQGTATPSINGGTSILAAIRAAVSPGSKVVYEKFGQFEGTADVGVVVIGELPYAEGVGDQEDLSLSAQDIGAIANTHAHVKRLIVVLLSGRPMVIADQFQSADAWVAAWLPGTEGAGVTDVLFGDYPFVGRLPYSWPRSNAQLPINLNNLSGKTGCAAPLFPFGYGLVEAGEGAVPWMECP